MDLESIIEEKIIKEIDLTEYKDQINKAVAAYFGSKSFAESVAEALYNEDVAAEVASVVGKKLVSAFKGKVNISIG